jgi:hypothetical protein
VYPDTGHVTQAVEYVLNYKATYNNDKDALIRAVYDLINKNRVGRRPNWSSKSKSRNALIDKVSTPPVPNTYPSSSPEHQAIEQARRLWGRRGYAIMFNQSDDVNPLAQVGEVINGELEVYGEGKTFEEAFEAAKQRKRNVTSDTTTTKRQS